MISAAVLRALELVRDFLSVRGEADDPTAALYRVRPGAEGSDQVPHWYADLLRLSDGGRVGAFQYRSLQDLSHRDNYLDMSPGALGGRDREMFLQVGVYVDIPVLMNRSDGSIWSFPDVSGYWWMGQSVELVSTDIDEYLHAWVFDRSKAIEHGELGWIDVLDQSGVDLPLSS
jgi:hypothetical protein